MGDEKPYNIPSALPVNWTDGATGEQFAQSQTKVVTPDSEALEMLAAQKVCGTCKYFEHARGQELMRAQQFVERLIREEKWQVHHLASPLNHLGVCGAHRSGGKGEQEMITGALHKACDQWRDGEGLVSISRKGNY